MTRIQEIIHANESESCVPNKVGAPNKAQDPIKARPADFGSCAPMAKMTSLNKVVAFSCGNTAPMLFFWSDLIYTDKIVGENLEGAKNRENVNLGDFQANIKWVNLFTIKKVIPTHIVFYIHSATEWKIKKFKMITKCWVSHENWEKGQKS